MTFIRRRKYGKAVVALFPQFGFTLQEAGAPQTREALRIAWTEEYGKHEAALFIAYLVYHGLYQVDLRRAHDLRERIRSVQQAWIEQDRVRPSLASRFESNTEAELEQTERERESGQR